MQRIAAGLVSVGALLAAACSGSPVNIGDLDAGAQGAPSVSEDSSATGGDSGAPGGDSSTTNTAGTGGEQSTSPLAHSWLGHAEQTTFPSDSDQVRIRLYADKTGTFEVGNVPPLPPATDPNVGYPEGPKILRVNLAEHGPFEGFVYAIENVTLSDTQLAFDLEYSQVWQDWCALQTPIADQADEGGYRCVPYRCVPNVGGTLNDTCSLGTGEPIDCGKMALCLGSTCSCSASACTVNSATAPASLVRNGNLLDGTLDGGPYLRFTLHLIEEGGG